MPTPAKGRRMGGSAAHQQHMLANLATALFEHGKITTTEARARRLRPVAERLITFAKRGDLHARRQVLTVVTDKTVVKTLFDEIGPSYATRQGGYTRITKVGPRKGDNAAMAVIELVTEAAEAKPSRRRARRAQPAAGGRGGRAAAAAAEAAAGAEAVADETVADEAIADEAVVDEAAESGTEQDVAATEDSVVEGELVEGELVEDSDEDGDGEALDDEEEPAEVVDEAEDAGRAEPEPGDEQ